MSETKLIIPQQKMYNINVISIQSILPQKYNIIIKNEINKYKDIVFSFQISVKQQNYIQNHKFNYI